MIFERMGLPVRAASTSDRPASQRLKTAGSWSVTPPSSQTRNTWSSHDSTSSQTVRPLDRSQPMEQQYLGSLPVRGGLNPGEALRASTAVGPGVSMASAAFAAPFSRSPLSQQPWQPRQETSGSHQHASQMPAHVPIHTGTGHTSEFSFGSQTREPMMNRFLATSGLAQHQTPATEPQSIFEAEYGRIIVPSEQVSTSQYFAAPSPQRQDVSLPQLSSAASNFPLPSYSASQPRPWTTHGSGDMAPPPVPDRFWSGRAGSGISHAQSGQETPFSRRRSTRLAVKNTPEPGASPVQRLPTAVQTAPVQSLEMPPRRELPFEALKPAMEGMQPMSMAPLDSQTATTLAPPVEASLAYEPTVDPPELPPQPVLDSPATPSPSKAKPRAKKASTSSPKKKPAKKATSPKKPARQAKGQVTKKALSPRKGKAKNAKTAESQEIPSPAQESQVITIKDSPEPSSQVVASSSQQMDTQLDLAVEDTLHRSPVLPAPTIARSAPPSTVAPSFDTFNSAFASTTATSHLPHLNSPIAAIPELSPHWTSPSQPLSSSPLAHSHPDSSPTIPPAKTSVPNQPPSSSPPLHHHLHSSTTLALGMATTSHPSPRPSIYPPSACQDTISPTHQISPRASHQQPIVIPPESPRPPTPEPLTPPNPTTLVTVEATAATTVVERISQRQGQEVKVLGREDIEKIFDQRFQKNMTAYMGRISPYMAQVHENLRKIGEVMGSFVNNDNAGS